MIAEEDGTVGTVCIYQATDHEAIRKHARRVGMPADATRRLTFATPVWRLGSPHQRRSLPS